MRTHCKKQRHVWSCSEDRCFKEKEETINIQNENNRGGLNKMAIQTENRETKEFIGITQKAVDSL